MDHSQFQDRVEGNAVASRAYLVKIQFERIQTYLFEVPELKMMVGANALIGEVLRGKLTGKNGEFEFANHVTTDSAKSKAPDNLPALAISCGSKFPDGFDLGGLKSLLGDPPLDDPLDGDIDNPFAAYEQGILIRDAGNFHSVFVDEKQHREFIANAESLLHSMLPGLDYQIVIAELKESGNDWKVVQQSSLSDAIPVSPVDGPQLQICQASGQGPANDIEQHWNPRTRDHESRYISKPIARKRDKGKYNAKSSNCDIVGLLQNTLLEKLTPTDGSVIQFASEFAEIAASGQLAVIVADGNSVGTWSREIKNSAETEDVFAQYASGERFFWQMRTAVRKSLVEALVGTFAPVIPTIEPTEDRRRDAQADKKVSRKLPFRLLMLGGDDLLLVCDAPFALPFLERYTKELNKACLPTTAAQGRPLAIGAGVAIVKTSFPFHRSHALAEELSKSAKQHARRVGTGQQGWSVSTVDWMTSTESWHGSVIEVRRRDAIRSYQRPDRHSEHLVEHLILTGKPYQILDSQGGDNISLGSLLTAVRRAAQSDDQRQPARTQLKRLAENLPLGKRIAEQAVQRMPRQYANLLAEHGIFSKPECGTEFPKSWYREHSGNKSLPEHWFQSAFYDFLELYELSAKQAGYSEREQNTTGQANSSI